MKRALLILLSVLLLASCASIETDINEVNEDGSPIWTTEVPQSNKYVYGVGSSKLSNEQNSRDSADSKARSDLARKLQVTIKEATSVYANDAEESTLNAYESITIETVNFTLQGVKIVDRHTAPDGTVWSLVSLEAKKVNDQYEIAANDYLNKLAKRKIDIEAQKASALADLARELDEANAALEAVSDSLDDTVIALAKERVAAAKANQEALTAGLTEYADNAIKAVEAEIKAIDVDKLAKAVADHLIEEGYTE